MKKIFLSSLALMAMASAWAQQKEGKITYQRTVQMQLMINTGQGSETISPQTRTDKFELNFANNQMSLKQMEDEIQDDNFNGGGGMMVRSFGGGADDITFCDFSQGKKVEQRDFMDKRFIISDSIKRNNWKLTEESKTILNHLCRKATTQRIGKRMTMNMDNGQMTRKEVADTSAISAWFTTDIPVSVGPDLQGQLPGAILELEMNGGKTVYTTLAITDKASLSQLKEPTKGKKLTQEEFNAERNKILDNMQKDNPGGTFRVRAG